MRQTGWIAGAVTHPGALRAKARAAGQSTAAFARAHDTGHSRTAKQSRLAETLAKLRPKRTGGMSARLRHLRATGAFGRQARG